MARYEVIQWRKRLERKGWRNAHRFPAPQGDWIEYHALWHGWLYSGHCRQCAYDMSYDNSVAARSPYLDGIARQYHCDGSLNTHNIC